MSYTTAIHALRAPDQLPAGSGPDVPKDIKNLADDVDTKLSPVSKGLFADRPAFGKIGRRYYATDDGSVSLDIGTAWVIEAPAAGNGIAVSGRTVTVDLATNAGLEFSSGKLRVADDETTIERSGSGIRVKDGAITAAKVADALKPSAGAGASTESLRKLGTAAGDAAAGNDSRFAALASHDPVSVLSAQVIKEIGQSGQIKAGRELAVADFTTLLGLGTPVLLTTPNSLTNKGSGGNLTNKGTVPLNAKGILAGSDAYQFKGDTSQALYIADTGSNDPFRIKTGSWGCWFRTPKRGTTQILLSKWGAATTYCWQISITTSNQVAMFIWDGGTIVSAGSWDDICDDRWHFAVATYDGNMLRLFIDGILQGYQAWNGAIVGNSAPLNIGAQTADGSTAGTNPHYGRVWQSFVTNDVLNEDQIRVLMAAAIPHSLATTPVSYGLSVRRKRRGFSWTTGDFASTPKHLYAGGSVTNLGSLGNMTGHGSIPTVAGPDGLAGNGLHYDGNSAYLSAAITGLPSGTNARSAVMWVKLTSTAAQGILTQEGGTGGTDFRFFYINSGNLKSYDGSTVLDSGRGISDGLWHMIALTMDNAAADGLKRKIYIDGKIVNGDNAFASTTLGTGAAQLVVAREAGTDYMGGSVGPLAIVDYTLTSDEILALYDKSSALFLPSPKDAGDHIEAADASNLYALFDNLDTQHLLDLKVAA